MMVDVAVFMQRQYQQLSVPDGPQNSFIGISVERPPSTQTLRPPRRSATTTTTTTTTTTIPRSSAGDGRHLLLRCGRRGSWSGTRGVGLELVLDPVVPQLGRELVEVPNVVSQVVEQNVDIPVRGGVGRR